MPGCASFSTRLWIAAALLAAVPAWAETTIGARLELLQREDARVAAVAFRMARAGAPSCARTVVLSGLQWHHLSNYAPEARGEAARLFGLGDRIAVAAVAPDSPGMQAGIWVGDALIAIDGVSVEGGQVAAILDRLEAGATRLAVERDGKRREVTLAAEYGCAMRLQLVPSTVRNAHAGGGIVQLSTALVEDTVSDDELAFLIGHELAHLIAPDARGREAEAVADRLGLTIMAAAGYDPAAAATVIARLGKARGLRWDPGHPSLAARVAALRALAQSQAMELPRSR